MAQVKFYSVTSLPETPNDGGVYFVENGELYKGAKRFGLGRVTVAASTDGISDMKRGDIVVTGAGAGWVYDGTAWQSIGGDTASLQGSWRTDIKTWTAGLAKGGTGSYITGITQDADGKVTASAAAFPALDTGDNDGEVKLGTDAAKVSGWGTVKADISNLQAVVSFSGSGDKVVTASTVTAVTGNFTNLNVSDTATFVATTVSASSLTVGDKTIETIANEQIAAIAAVTKSGESNGVTVNVTTKAGSVETVAVTTTPVGTITTSSVGSDKVVSEKAVKAYVDGKFTALDNAMHFKGVVKALPTEGNKAGDIVVIDATPTGKDPAGKALVQGQEYIHNGTSWELIGDQNTYALNAYAPGSEKVTSGAQTLPSAIHAVAAAVDTLNGEGEGSVKKALTNAIADLDSTASGGTEGVAISVGQTDGKLNAAATVTITKATLNSTLGTTNVADKMIATSIGATGVDTALATEKAVRDAITSAELVWLGADGNALA